MTACGAGQEVEVVRVSDANPDILRFLADRGIVVGSALKVVAPMTTTGLMTIRHRGSDIELSAPIATAIHVVADVLRTD
nr:FeoA family protein [Gulosibacter sp. 10]